MRFALIPVSFLALSACALEIPDFRGGGLTAPAEEPVAAAPASPVSAKERFVAAAEANGCVLNADNVATVMNEAQLSTGDLQNILLSLSSEGRAVPAENDSFRLTTPACAA